MEATYTKTEQIMLDVVRNLRANPEKYQSVKRALREAKTDQEKVHQLLNFATNDRELASLMPIQASDTTEPAAWTTVTVTTVFIPDTAY